MSNTKKNAYYSLFLIVVFMTIYYYRQWTSPTPLTHIEGVTMGVVKYNIKYIDEKNRNFKSEIDTILKNFNDALSTYIPNSDISKFNKDSVFVFKSPHFLKVLKACKEIYQNTNGAFDATVAPLVNAWGFGFKKQQLPDSNQVNELKKIIGFEKIEFDNTSVRKKNKNVMLDFGGIAGGYAVDIVVDFLNEKGIKNYMVEIGGELICKGKNNENKLWRLGIKNPLYKQQNQPELSYIVEVENRAMNTSGNYENFYIKDGKKYAHTINPKTGFPENNEMLSSSVFTKTCMIADGYATAFMVLGIEKSKEILKKHPELDAILIYQNKNNKIETFMTEGIKKYTTQL
ncbi:MAG: FAD:protein FMN transferase [Bacteroidetes bacterium]|nr:MAG: FAD:protein FMN transferase [Bacteroidota bacterium]TAG90645.1 MAG: FAD:protein FMN transferase [Bacteroidota bacterium]